MPTRKSRIIEPLAIAFFTVALCALPTLPSQKLYVSKLGDGSDGSSWAKAFHTIQTALNAVPDSKGGHRIIIRPDAYMEANYFPAQRGAAGGDGFVGDG